MALSVVVVGYASADRAVAVTSLPVADTTAVVRRRLSDPWPRVGGCGPQIALCLAAAGVPVTCLTWVAPDALGTTIAAELDAAGVDPAGVVVAGACTAESFLAYDRSGRSACFYDPGDAHLGGLAPPQPRSTVLSGV